MMNPSVPDSIVKLRDELLKMSAKDIEEYLDELTCDEWKKPNFQKDGETLYGEQFKDILVAIEILSAKKKETSRTALAMSKAAVTAHVKGRTVADVAKYSDVTTLERAYLEITNPALREALVALSNVSLTAGDMQLFLDAVTRARDSDWRPIRQDVTDADVLLSSEQEKSHRLYSFAVQSYHHELLPGDHEYKETGLNITFGGETVRVRNGVCSGPKEAEKLASMCARVGLKYTFSHDANEPLALQLLFACVTQVGLKVAGDTMDIRFTRLLGASMPVDRDTVTALATQFEKWYEGYRSTPKVSKVPWVRINAIQQWLESTGWKERLVSAAAPALESFKKALKALKPVYVPSTWAEIGSHLTHNQTLKKARNVGLGKHVRHRLCSRFSSTTHDAPLFSQFSNWRQRWSDDRVAVACGPSVLQKLQRVRVAKWDPVPMEDGALLIDSRSYDHFLVKDFDGMDGEGDQVRWSRVLDSAVESAEGGKVARISLWTNALSYAATNVKFQDSVEMALKDWTVVHTMMVGSYHTPEFITTLEYQQGVSGLFDFMAALGAVCGVSSTMNQVFELQWRFGVQEMPPLSEFTMINPLGRAVNLGRLLMTVERSSFTVGAATVTIVPDEKVDEMMARKVQAWNNLYGAPDEKSVVVELPSKPAIAPKKKRKGKSVAARKSFVYSSESKSSSSSSGGGGSEKDPLPNGDDQE